MLVPIIYEPWSGKCERTSCALQRGILIVVHAYGGKAAVRRLWEWDRRGVFIHDEEQFELRIGGNDYLAPVGFRWSDAYEMPSGNYPSDVDGKPFSQFHLSHLPRETK